MKKIGLVSLFLVLSIIASAQARIDTLFYDRNWRMAPNQFFAEYVVYTYESQDSLFASRYRSYYASGQMESEGEFIYIDPIDARNNVYNNERIVYAKNGDIIESLNYKNGTLDGLCVIRNEDNTIDYAVYSEGVLNEAYVLRQYTNGVCLKYNWETDEIIKDSPCEEDRLSVMEDGALWEYYNMNGVIVAANASVIREYGKYIQLSILVVNKTPKSFEFGANNVELIKASTFNSNMRVIGEESSLTVLDRDEYRRRVNNRQMWAEVGLGVLTGLSTGISNYNNTTYTNVYTPYGNATITTTYFDNAAYQNQLNRDASLLMAQSMQHSMDMQRLSAGYISENTICPNQELSGYVMIPHDFFYSGPHRSIEVSIEVDGIRYPFEFQW